MGTLSRSQKVTKATQISEMWNLLVAIALCSSQTGMAFKTVLLNKRSTLKAETSWSKAFHEFLRQKNSWFKLIYQKIALEYYGLRIKNKKVQWNWKHKILGFSQSPIFS